MNIESEKDAAELLENEIHVKPKKEKAPPRGERDLDAEERAAEAFGGE